MIKVLLPSNFDSKSITCDSEMAAFKHVSEIFPTAEIHGCFFHLAKNMKKNWVN
jgi:transposase-like protein